MQSTSVIFAYFHIYARSVTAYMQYSFLAGVEKYLNFFIFEMSLEKLQVYEVDCVVTDARILLFGLLSRILFIINYYVECYSYSNQSNSMQIETQNIAKA